MEINIIVQSSPNPQAALSTTLNPHNLVISCTEAEPVGTLYLIDARFPGTARMPKIKAEKRGARRVYRLEG